MSEPTDQPTADTGLDVEAGDFLEQWQAQQTAHNEPRGRDADRTPVTEPDPAEEPAAEPAEQ